MYVGDNFLIVSKSREKDIKNEILIHTLSLFENKNNFSLYLILNEQYEEKFLDKLVNCIFYIIQNMEYTGSIENGVHLYTRCKELVNKLEYFKETFGKYSGGLVLEKFNELIKQPFINDDYYINNDYFSKIFQINNDSIQMYIPQLSKVEIKI